MENFMKKVTNELQLMENKLSKYETLYLEKKSNDSGSCGAAVVDSVSGNNQEKDLQNLKGSFSNLKKLVENMQKQLEQVEKKMMTWNNIADQIVLLFINVKMSPKQGSILNVKIIFVIN